MNRISVIIPVRNMPDHIDACVRSVAKQLGPGDEVIVVDDGSSDGTAARASAAGARVVANAEATGPYGARNLGVRLSTAEDVLFVDARCRALDGLLDAHRALLAADEYAMSCTEVEIVAGTTLAGRMAFAQDSFRTARKVRGTVFDFYPTANLGVRRSAFESVSGFRAIRSGADADLCWRIHLAGLGRIGVDPRTLMHWIPRDRLRAFVEQNYRYGVSSVYLDRLYADVRAAHAHELAAAPPPPAAPPADAAVHAAGRAINVAFRAGRIAGRWRHRAVTAEPLDTIA